MEAYNGNACIIVRYACAVASESRSPHRRHVRRPIAQHVRRHRTAGMRRHRLSILCVTFFLLLWTGSLDCNVWQTEGPPVSSEGRGIENRNRGEGG